MGLSETMFGRRLGNKYADRLWRRFSLLIDYCKIATDDIPDFVLGAYFIITFYKCTCGIFESSDDIFSVARRLKDKRSFFKSSIRII